MAKQTQLRRGTAAEQATFAGAIGEVSINTTDSRIAVHNGSKLGGFPAIHENGDKGLDLTLTGNANLTAKNITLKDSTLDSSLSISSSGIRMRDGSIDRLVIDDSAFYIKDNSNVAIQNDRTFYNNAGGYVLSLDNKILYHNSTAIVDWSVQGLYSADSLVSMGWNQRQCYNNAEVITLDWNNNTLWRNNGGAQQIAFNWSGCQTYDQAGIQSINWNSRKLIKSDGSTEALDWENLRLMDSSTLIVVDWENKVLQNTDGNTTVDWQNNLLQFDNTTALDWASKYLYKYGGTVKTLDWQNQTLNNGSSIILDWNNRILSGTWNAEDIIVPDKINSTLRSLHSSYLIDGSSLSLDWENHTLSGNWFVSNFTIYNSLRDNDGAPSADTVNRQLFSAGIYPDRPISLDWENKILSGSWMIQSGQFTNRPTVNGVGVLLIGEDAGGLDSTYIVKTTGNQLITGIKTFSNLTNFPSGISGNASVFNILGQGLINVNAPTGINILSNNGIVNLSGASGINLNASNGYNININTYGTGRVNFSSRPTFNGNGIITYNDSPFFLTGNQTVAGNQTFSNMVKVGSANVIVASGNQTISGIKTFTNPIVIGTASALLSTGNQSMAGIKTFDKIKINSGYFSLGHSENRGSFDIKTAVDAPSSAYITPIFGGGNYTDDSDRLTYSIAAFKSYNGVKYFSPYTTVTRNETVTFNNYYIELTWERVSGVDGYRVVGDYDYYMPFLENYYYETTSTGLLNIGNGDENLFISAGLAAKPGNSGSSFYIDNAGNTHIYSAISNQLSVGYNTGNKAIFSVNTGGSLDISLSGSSSKYIKFNNNTIFGLGAILSGSAPAVSTAAGIKGQIATSGAFLFVATGTNQWGRVALSNW